MCGHVLTVLARQKGVKGVPELRPSLAIWYKSRYLSSSNRWSLTEYALLRVIWNLVGLSTKLREGKYDVLDSTVFDNLKYVRWCRLIRHLSESYQLHAKQSTGLRAVPFDVLLLARISAYPTNGRRVRWLGQSYGKLHLTVVPDIDLIGTNSWKNHTCSSSSNLYDTYRTSSGWRSVCISCKLGHWPDSVGRRCSIQLCINNGNGKRQVDNARQEMMENDLITTCPCGINRLGQ